MSDALRKQFEQMSDEALAEILAARDTEEWRPDVFPVIESILQSRGVEVAAATAALPEADAAEREGLVVAATFRDDLRAQLCRMALEQAGIESWLSNESLAAIAPHLGIALGIELQVRPEDAAAAADVIRAAEAGELAIREEPEQCPECGSAETTRAAATDRLGALQGGLLLGIPRPDVRWTWTCRSCGHEWE